MSDFDKYLVIANHDIQKANNMGELKSYVASILYEMDNLEDSLRQKENIIKEVREYILQHCEMIRDEEKNIDMVGRVEGIPLLEILDKENK